MKQYKAWNLFPEEKVYLRSEVDEAIAELKAENESLKAKLDTVNKLVKISKDLYDRSIESLKASHYAEMVDTGMRERRLKRALYKACANWAMNARMVEIETVPWGENHESRLWAGVYDKCLKKAEEYK